MGNQRDELLTVAQVLAILGDVSQRTFYRWREIGKAPSAVRLPPTSSLATGAIVGSVQVIGCVRDSRSRWAIPGYWHWLTASPRAADPVIPIKGQLSMFPAPVGWEASFRSHR
jgi:hypothetical protein